MSGDDDAEEMVLLAARVPKSLKERVDAHTKTNQEIVRQGVRTVIWDSEEQQIHRQMDELKQRRQQLVSERNSRERDIAEIEDQLAELERQLDTMESHERRIAREAVNKIDVEPSRGYEHISDAVETWADKAGMPLSAFWDLYAEVWNEVSDDE